MSIRHEQTVPGEGSPRTVILRLLQKRGEASIKDLELALGVTATAVREQLGRLLAEGVITAVRVHGDVGRPFYVYRLTAKAHEMLPKDYGTLACLLLEEAQVLWGPDGYAQLLERVGMRLEAEYAGSIVGTELETKLDALSGLLADRGLGGEVTRSGDGFVLHATSCPYFAVAKDHREICGMEQRMMSRLLGAEVELGPCLLEGHTACRFMVRPHSET